MNVLLCLSHSIEEYDMLRLLHGIGANVASIGGYIDPAHPHSTMRPALPEIPMVSEIKEAVDSLGTLDNLGAAQSQFPDAVLDWADVIVFHHYLERLFGQWEFVRRWLRSGSHRRVIWRSVGQSVEWNERQAQPFRNDGLERVAYSPKEANIPGYSGHDALIRFYKDPADFEPWIGDIPRVVNYTQHLYQREPYTNWGFWEAATNFLPTNYVRDKPYRLACGPGSEAIGGSGESGSAALMYQNLQHSRAYLYCGTQPASYTLGLIEAMMAGVPVVSIGSSWMRIFPYGPLLFEGDAIAGLSADGPKDAAHMLANLLADQEFAARFNTRPRAIELFGRDKIAAQWADYLGVPVPVPAALVAA